MLTRALTRVGVFAVGGSVLVSGCVSDPVLPDIAVRADHGVLTFVLPVCPDVRIETVQVIPVDRRSAQPPVWRAAGFKGDSRGPVALDARSWATVDGDGDFSNLQNLSVTFETTGLPTGTEIGAIAAYEGLPTGKYRVEGAAPMTLEQYRQRVEGQLHCPAASSDDHTKDVGRG